MLKPYGFSISDFRIQKFSILISRWVRVSLDLEVFVNWIDGKFGTFVEIIAFFLKMFGSHYYVDFFTSFQ